MFSGMTHSFQFQISQCEILAKIVELILENIFCTSFGKGICNLHYLCKNDADTAHLHAINLNPSTHMFLILTGLLFLLSSN